MNRLALTVRFILFAVFFLIGAGAIVLSILTDPELKEYCQSRAALAQIRQQNEKIADLTSQYETLISKIESNPELLERLIPLTFGRQPKTGTAVAPSANQPLQVQTEELLDRIKNTPAENKPFPVWLARILERKNRQGLFLAGAGLILITFIFFGSTKEKGACKE